jgi:plasmid stabilization system protein ParE
LQSFPVRQRLVFYRTQPGNILVVRVLDGRRDLDAIFSLPPN